MNIIAFYPGGGGNRYYRYKNNETWKEHNVTYDSCVKNQFFENRYLTEDKNYSFIDNFVLTHCVNTPRLKKIFPNSEITIIKSSLKKSLLRELTLAGYNRYITKINTVELDKIEHYRAYKDSAWPDIQSIEQFNNLPEKILLEVNEDYKKNIKQYTPEFEDTLARLKQHYLLLIDSYSESIKWHQTYYKNYPYDTLFAKSIIDIDGDDSEFSKFMRKELNLYNDDTYNRVWELLVNE